MKERTPAAGRAVDALFELLMRPRVRRLRRWSFVVTVPAGVALFRGAGLRPSLGDGLAAGLALAALDLALLATVAFAGTRLLGAQRREIVLDFLMHPSVRRLLRTELELQLTLPRALVRRLHAGAREPEFTYHRGSWELGFALALMPALATEALIVHLVIPPEWPWVRAGAAALHAIGMLYVLAFAVGPRVYPHRIAGDVLELRSGALYRARVPLAAIVAAERRRGRVERAVELGDDGARLGAQGRVDLALSLSEPVAVERPFGEPFETTTIAIAADDPEAMLAAIERGRLAGREPVRERSRRRAVLDAASAVAVGFASS